jgi:hypothetical protein
MDFYCPGLIEDKDAKEADEKRREEARRIRQEEKRKRKAAGVGNNAIAGLGKANVGANFVGGGGGGLSGGGDTSADWECPLCGAVVFASRDQCFACGTAKPVAKGSVGGPSGSPNPSSIASSPNASSSIASSPAGSPGGSIASVGSSLRNKSPATAVKQEPGTTLNASSSALKQSTSNNRGRPTGGASGSERSTSQPNAKRLKTG